MAFTDLYRVSFECDSYGNVWNFTHAYRQSAGTNDADTLEELAIAINGIVNPDLLEVLGVYSSHRLTEVYPITDNGEIPGLAPPVFQQGAWPDDALAANMAAKIRFTTDAPNSKYNGGCNISGIPLSFQDAGLLTAPAAALYLTLAGSLATTISSVGTGLAEFIPCVISRWSDGIKRPDPVAFNITSQDVSTRVGNMRRRTTELRKFDTGA